jgi:hypothetical protein
LKDCLFPFLLSYQVCSQIWLNYFLDEISFTLVVNVVGLEGGDSQLGGGGGKGFGAIYFWATTAKYLAHCG